MIKSSLQPILFVGLGNPGPLYEMTRHNMGFLVIQSLARVLGCSLREDRRFTALLAKKEVEHYIVHLFLPLTFMNLSGNAVRRYVEYFKIPLSSIVVVSDDIALPFNTYRFREGGSAGGHNGLKSIQEVFGTPHYKRLRMGIGHPGETMLVDYVLERFNQVEQQELPRFIESGAQVLHRIVKEGFASAVNARDLTKPPVTG